MHQKGSYTVLNKVEVCTEKVEVFQYKVEVFHDKVEVCVNFRFETKP